MIIVIVSLKVMLLKLLKYKRFFKPFNIAFNTWSSTFFKARKKVNQMKKTNLGLT